MHSQVSLAPAFLVSINKQSEVIRNIHLTLLSPKLYLIFFLKCSEFNYLQWATPGAAGFWNKLDVSHLRLNHYVCTVRCRRFL